MGKNQYKYEGDAFAFLGMLKWTLVSRKAYDEKKEDWQTIITNPQKVMELAEEYGMDDYSLINELDRLTKELKNSLPYQLEVMEITKNKDN